MQFENHKLNFYKKVFQKLRAKGFTISVGCQATFTDSTFGEAKLSQDVNNWYNHGPIGTQLDSQRYLTEKTQMLQTIIDELAPDYLTVEMEPQTQYVNLKGLVNYDAASFTSYINYYLENLNKGNVKIGAGAGTWNDIKYFDAAASIPGCDFLDMHIYPVNRDYFVNKVFQVDSIASKYNKEIIIGEAWCDKETDSELSSVTNPVANSANISARDFFDYYQSVDTLFVKAIVNTSYLVNSRATCFFWPTILFGYLAYDSTVYNGMSSNQIIHEGQQIGYQRMLNKQPSAAGLFLQRLLKDSSATGIVKQIDSIDGYTIFQNYPNPFNPTTNISYNLPARGFVSIKVYDTLGRQIKTLVNETQDTGFHNAIFSADKLPSGIYFYSIEAGNFQQSKPMVLLK